ncbi:ATP-binding cassette domain-containing protein [Streptomyces sp. A7024]|uniref:ATP-binding cassette domain-containing protein n=2 Tax=Streptomyces coryli TaxID=1128680 RepID=A0A6G4U0R2_9ACTN|nr:ATP-binding cassette domain-containing protein [Streptomyces coryli]NGN65296.1 ATP-binding cassette domain-containing protein [Streptomyces coryli]
MGRPPADPVLSLSGLTRRYGTLTAVDDVSLHLATGARHAVIGPNGAGKTTLLNLIAGTARPDEGAITLAGRDITRRAPARRSRLGIARSFQQPSAIRELTVLENVMLATWRHHPLRPGAWRRPKRLRQLAATASGQLEAVGLADVVHQPAGALSHGQRRLLDLAAALAARPSVLLLDEPAAGLTDRDVVRLLRVLDDISDDVAVLLVEHHTDLVAEFADTVTVLMAGRVLVSGPTREALSHPEVRDAYLDPVATAADAPASDSDRKG